jgi:hypothetical protein
MMAGNEKRLSRAACVRSGIKHQRDGGGNLSGAPFDPKRGSFSAATCIKHVVKAHYVLFVLIWLTDLFTPAA